MLMVNQLIGFGVGQSGYSPTGVELTPTMTTNTAPAGYTASADSSFDASSPPWKAFDKSYADYSTGTWISNATNAGWVQIQLPSAGYVASYKVSVRASTGGNPKDWVLRGSPDGSSWTPVDTVTAQTGWTDGLAGERTFNVLVPMLFAYWRLDISAVNTVGNNPAVTELRLFS